MTSRTQTPSTVLDEGQNGAKYQQLADLLRRRICTGDFQVGDTLPSEAELCDHYAVSRITVRSALQCLDAEGLIQRTQGRRTSVARVSPVLPGVDESLIHILFLLIGVGTEKDYNYREIATAERFLSARGVPFSWAAMTTEDLVAGRFPALLEKGLCQGVLLDGHITDAHMTLARRFNVKVVAVGTHELSPEQPQVCAHYTQPVRRITEQFGRAGREVLLLVEPMRYAASREILAGYTAGLAAVGQPDSRVFLCPDDVLPENLGARIAAQPDRFAVVTTDELYMALREQLLVAGHAGVPVRSAGFGLRAEGGPAGHADPGLGAAPGTDRGVPRPCL